VNAYPEWIADEHANIANQAARFLANGR